MSISLKAEDLLEKFLNILGYYKIEAEEYYSQYTYGYEYYIPSMQQVDQQLSLSDEAYVDVAGAEIAKLIADTNEEGEDFTIQYDFKPLIGSLGALQKQRIFDTVLDELEKKGYRLIENDGEEFLITIKWTIERFRLFKRYPRQNPPI